jgi:hypothetical protein
MAGSITSLHPADIQDLEPDTPAPVGRQDSLVRVCRQDNPLVLPQPQSLLEQDKLHQQEQDSQLEPDMLWQDRRLSRDPGMPSFGQVRQRLWLRRVYGDSRGQAHEIAGRPERFDADCQALAQFVVLKCGPPFEV